nr:hypothetical protein HK105_006885 [Polyrhizophydium stewartii]
MLANPRRSRVIAERNAMIEIENQRLLNSIISIDTHRRRPARPPTGGPSRFQQQRVKERMIKKLESMSTKSAYSRDKYETEWARNREIIARISTHASTGRAQRQHAAASAVSAAAAAAEPQHDRRGEAEDEDVLHRRPIDASPAPASARDGQGEARTPRRSGSGRTLTSQIDAELSQRLDAFAATPYRASKAELQQIERALVALESPEAAGSDDALVRQLQTLVLARSAEPESAPMGGAAVGCFSSRGAASRRASESTGPDTRQGHSGATELPMVLPPLTKQPPAAAARGHTRKAAHAKTKQQTSTRAAGSVPAATASRVWK